MTIAPPRSLTAAAEPLNAITAILRGRVPEAARVDDLAYARALSTGLQDAAAAFPLEHPGFAPGFGTHVVDGLRASAEGVLEAFDLGLVRSAALAEGDRINIAMASTIANGGGADLKPVLLYGKYDDVQAGAAYIAAAARTSDGRQ